MIGVGLFGNGKYKYTSANQPADNTSYDSSTIFGNNGANYASSRFEYGLSTRIGTELFGHYRINLGYDLESVS